MQLIVFFDKITFYTLVKEHASSVFKSLYMSEIENPDGSTKLVFFNQGNDKKVIVVDNNGVPQIIDFVQKDVEGASIILIPDTYKIEYKPNQEFLILRHSKPYDAVIIGTPIQSPLEESENKTFHNVETLYYHLLKFIGNAGGINFHDLLANHFPNWYPKVNAVMDYLYECLNYSKISKNTTRLIELGINIDNLTEKKLTDLSAIRDNLLSQCDLEPSN